MLPEPNGKAWPAESPGRNGRAEADGQGESGESESDLGTSRSEIERLDRALVGIIAQRMQWARTAGAVKRASGRTVMDPAREAAVVRQASVLARAAGLPDDDVRAIFWHLISLSRRAQLGGNGLQ
ncbi:MAG: chorismate mutase [Gemmatimonadaceae bacterium]